MKRTLITTVILLLHLGLWSQSVVINDQSASGFDLCGAADSLRVEVVNQTGGLITGLTLTVDMPEGMAYVAGSVSATGTESNISDLDTPVFTLADLGDGDTVWVTMAAAAGCATDVNDLDIVYTLAYVSGGVAGSVSHLQLLNSFGAPDLAITNTTHTAPTYVKVGDVFTHSITLTNGSFDKVQALQLMDISGAGLQVTGTSVGTLSFNGDTAFVVLDSVGAGQSLTVTLTKEVVGCSDHTSEFLVYWGCPGDLCNTLNMQEGTLTQIDQYLSHIGIYFDHSNQITSCKPDTVYVTYVNESTEPNVPGSGDMYNLYLNMGEGQSTYRNYDWLTMSDWMIGNTAVTPDGGCDSLNACVVHFDTVFTTDPDGPGGLSDLDGDGYFDDLAVGDSVKFSFVMTMTCRAPVCPERYFLYTYYARIWGEDQCGNQTSSYYNQPVWWYYEAYYVPVETVTPVDLVAGPNGDTLTHFNQILFYRGMNSCIDNPKTTLYMKMPQGVSVAGTPTFNGLPCNMANLSYSNDTLIYEHYGVIGYGYAFRWEMELEADCSANTGFAEIPYRIELVCDTTCPCLEIVKCDTAAPFYIHGCNAAPCNGATARSQTLQRHNTGWTDATRTARADPTTTPSLRLDRVIKNDTILHALPAI
ncbi:MAG: hypothetical protein AAF570_01625, partial [Bacteroidota bacterium]